MMVSCNSQSRSRTRRWRTRPSCGRRRAAGRRSQPAVAQPRPAASSLQQRTLTQCRTDSAFVQRCLLPRRGFRGYNNSNSGSRPQQDRQPGLRLLACWPSAAHEHRDRSSKGLTAGARCSGAGAGEASSSGNDGHCSCARGGPTPSGGGGVCSRCRRRRCRCSSCRCSV